MNYRIIAKRTTLLAGHFRSDKTLEEAKAELLSISVQDLGSHMKANGGGWIEKIEVALELIDVDTFALELSAKIDLADQDEVQLEELVNQIKQIEGECKGGLSGGSNKGQALVKMLAKAIELKEQNEAIAKEIVCDIKSDLYAFAAKRATEEASNA